MIRPAVFLTAFWLSISFAEKNVNILAIYQLDPGRTTPPYDVNITVSGLADDATLNDVMHTADREEMIT